MIFSILKKKQEITLYNLVGVLLNLGEDMYTYFRVWFVLLLPYIWFIFTHISRSTVCAMLTAIFSFMNTWNNNILTYN